MAVAPLFYADRDAILACVRMSGMCSDAPGQALVDRSILKVKAGIQSKLGFAAVISLQALGYIEEPTNDAEVGRAKAQIMECEWLHAELLCILPSLLLEGGSKGIDPYQDENPFRLTDEDERSQLIKKLMASVNQALLDLDATDTKQPFRFELVGPDVEAPNTMCLLSPPTNYSLTNN